MDGCIGPKVGITNTIEQTNNLMRDLFQSIPIPSHKEPNMPTLALYIRMTLLPLFVGILQSN